MMVPSPKALRSAITDHASNLGFDIGWDLGFYGLPPIDQVPPEVREGYLAAKESRTYRRRPTRFEKKWVQLRLNAYLRGKEFSSHITPRYLELITPLDMVCPVTQLVMTEGTGEPTDWSVDRRNNDLPYVQGNVVVMSVLANQAKSDLSLDRIEELAKLNTGSRGLSAVEWQRVWHIVRPTRDLSWDGNDGSLNLLTGEAVSLGTKLSPVAFVQLHMALCLVEEKAWFVSWVGDKVAMPSGRKSVKAFCKLYKQMLKRVSGCQAEPQRIWASKAVHRHFHAWLKTVDPEILENFVDQAWREMI